MEQKNKKIILLSASILVLVCIFIIGAYFFQKKNASLDSTVNMGKIQKIKKEIITEPLEPPRAIEDTVNE